eukprot:3466445-Pyramimonas_sp.AAC.1
MALTALPNVIFNASGNAYRSADLELTTLGNFGTAGESEEVRVTHRHSTSVKRSRGGLKGV